MLTRAGHPPPGQIVRIVALALVALLAGWLTIRVADLLLLLVGTPLDVSLAVLLVSSMALVVLPTASSLGERSRRLGRRRRPAPTGRAPAYPFGRFVLPVRLHRTTPTDVDHR
jgi:hypothetical protein